MTLARLKGQPYARRVLDAALASGRTASAYLFEGPPGCGKKTAAVDLAAALLGGGDADADIIRRVSEGVHPDVKIFAPSGTTFKVELAREILREASLKPFEGSRRVFILDKVEAFNDATANTLLKALEEPAPGFTWILVTTQRAKLLDTIASRCQAVRFHPLDEATLRTVLEQELKVGSDRARDLAALSGGSVKLAAWLDKEDGKALLEKAEGFLEAAASGSLLKRLDWAESADSKDRKALDRLLNVTWVLLRERWVEAKGLTALRMLQTPPKHGKSLNAETLESLMQAVTRCQAALAANSNIALALDLLSLSASKAPARP